ncbi:hypothetical protein VM1G_05792 [Cytospora mali]|uniref:Uncharacterized protein n=1 Tax=Cytospora mali TaxID=578113 RepID=A0A194W2V2_CYTMA|nr:hypothetical protein VM1G_05792 [Valsa mali]
MANNQDSRPLDDEFAFNLINRVIVREELITEASQAHWREVINRIGRSSDTFPQYVARRFSTGEWRGDEEWFVDPGIQEIFQGYDRMDYARQSRPAGRRTVQNNPRQGRMQSSFGGLTPVSDFGDDHEPVEVEVEDTANVQDDITEQQVHQAEYDARNLIEFAQRLRLPASHQRPRPAQTRLPSPPYDEHVDLDNESEQAQPQPAAPANDGSIPPPMQPSQQDMERSHTWKGQRLPALGVRLNHLLNFLCDEDVDRDISWKEHLAEAEEYLHYIKTNASHLNIGPETREMVDRLLDMITAHKIFEKYHYDTFLSTKIITPDQVGKPAPRLKYDCDQPIILRGKGRPGACKWDEIMPGDFPDQPRRQGLVNNMWLTAREAKAGLTEELRAQHQMALAQAEDAWWQLEPDEDPPEDNIAVIENRMYEDIVAADRGRGLSGWVNTQPAPDGGDGLTRWITSYTALGDCAVSFARERGARRAGLQGALRQFQNMENQLACTPWRRLVLPPTAEELRLARRDAGAGLGRKWPLKALEPDKLRKTDGKDDPQGFTVAMEQFWRDQRDNLRQARESLIGQFGARGSDAPLGAVPAPGFVTPPKSVWGPYVWRAIDPDTENHQDMLKQMRAAKKLFDRELRIAPRRLLTYMEELYRRGYADQGLTQRSVVFQDPQTGNNVVVDLHPRRDFTGANGELTDLDKMELYWLRFILSNSITTQMTQELKPRTSLYMLFAERLRRIFDDISDPLFSSNATKVSVEDLLEYMHKKADGPVKTVKFYAHDAQRWLERLAAQGRCRYKEDWRCYGWVQRPVLDCHPEHLINWQVTDEDHDIIPSVQCEDMVFAPRLRDLRSWADVITDGKPPRALCGNVTNYFQCLAYRWGRYMHKLENPENGLEKEWKTKAAIPITNMQRVIEATEEEYQYLADWNQRDNSWDHNPLVSLVKRTLPEKQRDASLSPGASIQIIRDHIINEAMRNDSMLWPARNARSCTDISDEKVRPPLWDWAKAEVRGPVKKFFDMNRWPLQLQTEETQRRIKSDKDLSVQQLWNPVTEDPTPWTYYRPKARPYVEEKVKYRAGHRIYPIGDTPHQKRVIENQMYARLGRAMGLPDTDQRRPGLIGRLSGFFRRGGRDDDDEDDHDQPGSRLPRVNPKDIPKSYDPRAEANRKRKADGDARNEATKVARLMGADLPDDAQEIPDVDAVFDIDREP